MKIYDENQFTKSKLDETKREYSLGLEDENKYNPHIGLKAFKKVVSYALFRLEKSDKDKFIIDYGCNKAVLTKYIYKQLKKCPTTSRGRAPNFINQYLYLYKDLNSYLVFASASATSSAFLAAVFFAAGFLAAGAFVFSSFARSFSSVASIFSILV